MSNYKIKKMSREIDLLINYPRPLRDIKARAEVKTEADRQIARQFGCDFFDGERRHGYGGFNYHPKYWQPVIPTFKEHYALDNQHHVLDIGCAKGFMLHDMMQIIPGIQVTGIDISEYAIKNCLDGMQPYLQVADARELHFEYKSFDLTISINTLHNLEEKERMYAWNLTAKTIKSVDEWKVFLKKIGYQGDYYWFIP